jgi:hypothetical protein
MTGRKTLKVAVCVPVYGDPRLRFVVSLIGMLNHFHTANITDPDGAPLERTVKVFWVSTSNLPDSRTKLCFDAMLWEADYMLWLDADHTFPPETLARLWAHNLPIVGCNYARRIIPTAPTAAKFVADDAEGDKKALLYTTIEKAAAGELEEVAHLGLGVCMMDMRVFDALQAASEARGEKNFLPLFKFAESDDEMSGLGEDVWFFRKCRDAGIRIVCDHGLSWEVGHIHEYEVTNQTACVHKEKWDEKQAATREKYNQRVEQISAAA